jgi:peptidoglycan LD-endopeptidase LytH
MSSLLDVLKKRKGSFHPVVPFEPARDKLLKLDFTENNKEISDEMLGDTNKFTGYINEKLKNSNARYGIGGYNEHRIVYRMSRVFDPVKPGDEPRRLHLGTDIWGKPRTAVMAPMDGIVHSFGIHDEPGNYGTVIILSHRLDGKVFFTLYGHLGQNSVKNLEEGDRVAAGDIFGELGIPAENGQWPPHLHFQIIIDLDNYRGDYPGVCKYSEREAYLANSPDPDLILNLDQYIR